MYTIQKKEEKNFKVGAWFSNKNPAVIESEVGKGIVVMFLSSLDRDWNDFPIQPTYLPWIQRWIQYSALGLENISRQNLLVGEPFLLNSSDADIRSIVRAPDGTLSLMGNEDLIDTSQPGVYHLFSAPLIKIRKNEGLKKLPIGSKPTGTVTVNIDTLESVPGKISQNEIASFLEGMDIEIREPYFKPTKPQSSDGTPLTTPFLLLVAGMLLIEGWMVRKE